MDIFGKKIQKSHFTKISVERRIEDVMKIKIKNQTRPTSVVLCLHRCGLVYKITDNNNNQPDKW